MNALKEKIVLLVLLIPLQLQAATNFIEKGSSDWNMLHIIDGVDPASSDSDFNSTWYHPSSGGYVGGAYDGPAFTGGLPSPFHFGTVNGLSGGTSLSTPPSGSRYTSYFYKVFDAGSGAENIKLSLLADDGAFVYLNGQLIARYNLTDPDIYSKFTSANGNESDYSDLTILGNATLQPGLNLLAISVHQTNNTSSDLGFDLELSGDFGVTLTDADSSDWAVLNTVDPASNDGYDPVAGHSSQAGDPDFNDTWKNQTFGGYTGVAYDGPGFTTGQQGPFSYGGVNGIPSPNTVLTAPNSGTRHTEYFIREIDGGATGFDKATFTVLADDGAFLYLNGTLVGVVGNLPNDASLDTWSRFAGSVGSETTLHSVTVTGAGIIQPGSNLLAVSVHQHSTTSSDLGFSLKLIGEEIGAPTIVRGPYLQSGSHDRMTLRWRTSEASDSIVRYGDSPTNLTESTPPLNNSVTDHIVTLTGLTAATQYYYQIESTNSSGNVTQGGETDYYFKTSPAPGARVPTRLWVIGDSGTRTSNQDNVYEAYRTRTGTAHTDAWLMLGDNAYNSGTDSEFQGAVFDAYPELLRNTTMWSCIGNHETYTNGGSPYLDIHSFPTAGECGGVASGSEHYYSYDHGNIHFVCLDSATSNVSDLPGSGGMIDWLEADLQATDKDWIIAYFHHGPYTKGSHDSDTESAHINARKYITPLLEDYGVDLVLSGHSHTYERSMLVNGHHSNMSSNDSSSSTFDPNSHVIDNGNGSGLGSIDGSGNFVIDGGDGSYLKELGSTQSGTIYSVCGASGKLSGWDNGSTATVNPEPHPVFVVNLRTLGSMIINVDGTTLNAQYLDDNNEVRDDFTIIKSDPVATNLPPVIGDAGFAPAENASIGTAVGLVTGTDPDVDDVLTYSISGGNTGGAFSINSSTGAITTAAALDYETIAQYLLTITVTDDGTPQESDTASITMNISDVNEAPSLTNSTGVNGKENAAYAGTIAGTGMDPDAGDTLSYSRISGPSWLVIAAGGTLTGTPAPGDAGVNTWTIRVTDSGGLSADATLEITILANSPPVANNAILSVSENSSPGTVVGTVVATDPDAGDGLTFAITGGNSTGAFTINPLTGVLTTSAVLDYEGVAQYVLTVTATDDGSPALSDSASVTVNLLDVNEAPSLANSIGGSAEADQAYSGNIAGSGSDPDTGDTLSYGKVSGPTWLAIAPDGTLSGTPATEDAGINLWAIRVMDSGGLPAEATLQITVTVNSPPTADDAVLSVSENSALGTAVGTVLATDPDAGDLLNFAITGGNLTGAFSINALTGAITTSADLDFETTPNDSLTVTVTDDGSPALSDTANITINLLDVNEAPSLADTIGGTGDVDQAYSGSIGGSGSDPDDGDTLTYEIVTGPSWLAIAPNGTLSGTPANEDIGDNLWTVRVTDSGGLTAEATLEIIITANNPPSTGDAVFSVPENSLTGTTVGTVTATDPDTGDLLSFAITGGNSAGAFNINPNTGELTSALPLDFEDTSSFVLTVTVSDDGSPALSDSASVTVNLLDVNEAPSLANSIGSEGEVDQPYNGSIAGSGSDPDTDDILVYSKVSGPNWLEVASDGALSGTPAGGNAGDNLWTVRVTDSGGLLAEATLEIAITVNSPPIANDALFSVPENSAMGTAVGTVVASDPDAGDLISFAITGGNATGAFSIDALTGALTTAADLDFETTPGFALTVTVTDDGSPRESDTAIITISVSDENESPDLTNSTGADGEEAVAYTGTIAGTGTDPDAGDTLNYLKISGPLWLNLADNGSLTGTPDNSDIGLNSWTVRVTDSGGLTADATLEITIAAANAPPTASFTLDVTDLSVQLTDTSMDDDGTVTTWSWNFGDGNFSNEQNPSHTYADEGTYALVLTVTDDDGATNEINQSVTVTIITEPVVATGAASAVTDTGADIAYSVNDDGGEAPAMTLYYGESDGGVVAGNWSSSVVLGSQSAGTYSTALGGLSGGTTYYHTVRGINTAGEAWGSTGSFTTTPDSSPKLVRTSVSDVDNNVWTAVDLGQEYHSPVVIATPIYPDGGTAPPVVTRVRNAAGSGFEIRLDRADGLTDPVSCDVSIVVVDEGVYTLAEHGVTMEAVRFTSTVTAGKSNWAGEVRSYQNSYSAPVVLGQVMSDNDAAWSTFWCQGSGRTSPPSASNLVCGKMVGEDPNKVRADETIGYLVIESGTGAIGGVAYTAGLGSDSVSGYDNNSSGYAYPISGLATASAVALSQAGMDGGNGSYAVLVGSGAISATSLQLVVDEDAMKDSERKHTKEQVGYLVFE